MTYRLILLLLTVIVWPVGVNSQSTYRQFTYPDQPNLAYFKTYLQSSKAIVTAPAHWSNKEWIVAGGVVTTGVLFYIYDDQIRNLFQRNQSSALTSASKYVFDPWGNGLYPAALLGSYYLYGLATKDPTARQIALGGTQAWMLSALTVTLLKHLTHRHRPDQDFPANPRLWEGPFNGFEYTSFPSGHTITAFSLATFFASTYQDKPWIGILSYGIATGVALSRVYEDKHWSSDVFIGAALGFAIGKTVHRLMQPGSKLSMGTGRQGGLAIRYTF